MEATLDQAALHALTLEQDHGGTAAFTGNISRNHGSGHIDINAGEAIHTPGYTPAVTSRISVQKVCSVVRTFDNFKRNLVEEIGFGGMLKIQMLTRLNLKFSAWLMERVESGKLKIDEERILQIQDHDVEKVFGLPCGNRWICPGTPEGVPSEACIEFLRVCANLSKGAHSLKAAEAYLLRDDINEHSRKVEIDCFKIAFVIFVVGHLLAPSTKNDYISIDFWAALNDTSQIKEFNWCCYVLEHLIRAARKLKSDIRNRHMTLNLVGCHIFLQVFYLDNLDLDLGPLSKTHEDLPRISLFDYESIKKMTENISNDVGGDTSFAGANFRCAQDVCYSRVQHESHTEEPFTLETNRAESRTEEPFTLETNRAESHIKEPLTLETDLGDIFSDLPCLIPGFGGRKDKDQHNPVNIPMLRSSFTETGPEDFSNHLRLKYPSLVGHPLVTILEEHNANIMKIIDDISDSYQVAMCSFVDELLGSISKNRCCCKALGRTDCLLRPPRANHGNVHRTPTKRKSRFCPTETGHQKKPRENPTS